MIDTERDEIYQQLGHGILLRLDGLGESTEIIDGIVHFRFMDQLYLPARTNELDIESIKVINRWREELLESAKLPHRDRVREIAVAVIRASSGVNLLEIGPGKFPLVNESSVREYVALEIDEEAREHNVSNHLRCVSNPAELMAGAGSIDTVAALFSMQFHVSAETFRLIGSVRSDAIMFINVPTTDEQLIRTRIQQLEQAGATVTTFDLSHGGVHDVLLVAGHRDAGSRLHLAIRAARVQIAKQWPRAAENGLRNG